MADVKILEPVLLSALAGQGIAASNVELWHDYAPRSRGKSFSPYVRHYLDNASEKKFAVISGLPGCDAFGQTYELAWSDKNDTVENGNNIFHAAISKGTVRLVALSDQPTGARNSDEVAFHPQLFIDGAEILPLSDNPGLLAVDPANENYHNNVLEWDYGVCLRRVRLIEGRFLGSWVFLTHPKGDVLIKYNQSGKLRLRLRHAKDEDTEFVPKAFFDTAGSYPVTISDSATFYPDANPETSSVDGVVYPFGERTWMNERDGAGSYAEDSPTGGAFCGFFSGSSTNTWQFLLRSLFLFDTSSLPDSATTTAATLSLFGYQKLDGGSWSPDTNIYSSNPASNTSLAAGDYQTLGATPFCAAPITYTGFNAGGYTDYVLNAAGIAAISKTGVSKFGVRNANYDVANIEPTWASSVLSAFYITFSEYGTGYQPKLVVTYSTGVTAISAAETGSGAEAKTSGNPIVVTGGTETGSGAETALKIGAFNCGDAGLGSETSRTQKEAMSGDGGIGYDARKSLVKPGDTGSDMRLSKSLGQAGMPSRQARMPSKGVNI